MADFASATTDLLAEFATAFAAVEPTVAIRYENAPGPVTPPAPTVEWVRIGVVFGTAALPEIGGRLSDTFGRVVVQVFVPLGRGTGRARALASTVRNIFQGRRIGDVSCLESQVVAMGATPEQFWQENVSTRFRFESTPA